MHDEGLPRVAVHYAHGPPFHSMMDLDEALRDAVLGAGSVSLPDRYRDPTYIDTRERVEREMLRQFLAVGGDPLRRHPHYALIGRSARSERTGAPGRRAYLLDVDRLPAAHTSFTWGDSFRFDEEYRRATGRDHPGSGVVYRWGDLHTVLERWAGSTPRPAWQEIEVQLWYDPLPSEYVVVDC